MAEGEIWTFKQLGGSQRTFTLSGWSAPFGRPRQGAVVEESERSRTERTYYPGSDEPTRHLFGTRWEDWELKGRFRDRELGKGGARAKADELKVFRRDQQLVRITWGNGFGPYLGFLDELTLGHESAGEITWKLVVSIDKDESRVAPRVVPPPSPQVIDQQLLSALNAIVPEVEGAKLPADALDALGDAVGLFTAAIGYARGAVGALGSFKDATFAELNRAVGAVRGLRASGTQLREVFVSSVSNAQLLAANTEDLTRGVTAEDLIGYGFSTATVEEQMRDALNACADVERASDLARVGRTKAVYVATPGDTWESISVRFYGTPERANDLRDANDAPPGARPTVGAQYLIPK